MTTGTSVDFVKLEGCGNDYLFFDADALPDPVGVSFETEAPTRAPLLCHRNHGVGADGIVLFQRGIGRHLGSLRNSLLPTGRVKLTTEFQTKRCSLRGRFQTFRSGIN